MGPQSSTLPKCAVCSRSGDSRKRTKRVAAKITRPGIRSICLALLIAGCLFSASAVEAQTAQLPLVLPSAIAFDSQGNLYVADAGAHVVREVSSTGAVTIVA